MNITLHCFVINIVSVVILKKIVKINICSVLVLILEGNKHHFYHIIIFQFKKDKNVNKIQEINLSIL